MAGRTRVFFRDALSLGSSAERRGGSNPPSRISNRINVLRAERFHRLDPLGGLVNILVDISQKVTHLVDGLPLSHHNRMMNHSQPLPCTA
jgi:hypothetical protein